jgi:hypothetical protein
MGRLMILICSLKSNIKETNGIGLDELFPKYGKAKDANEFIGIDMY